MELPDLPAVDGVAHRQVAIRDGIRLHVAEAGDGPPLVLLHGFPQHWWCWRHLIPRLSTHRRLLMPDLRGFGWSDAPPGDYAKATWARDLIALLDAEGLDRVDVIAHDWGGFAAILAALDHPQRIERLVVLDVGPPWPQASLPRPRHATLPLLASYQALLATPVVGPGALAAGPWLVRTLIRAGSGPRARWTDDELDVYAAVLREPARARVASACYRTFLTRELPAIAIRGDRSRQLRVPTLLLMGDASPLRRVLRPRPQGNLRIRTVPAAGHFLPEEAPHDVLRLAEGWLDRRPDDH